MTNRENENDSLRNAFYAKNLNSKLQSIQEIVWFHLIGGVALILKNGCCESSLSESHKKTSDYKQ